MGVIVNYNIKLRKTRSMQSHKLFASGIAGNLTPKFLEEYFKSRTGVQVSCFLPSHREIPGFNRGFGIIEAGCLEDAQLILSNQVYEIAGRPVTVTEYLSHSNLKNKQAALKKKRIFVCAKGLGQLNLRKIFSAYGKVLEAYAIKDLNTKKTLNYGYVLFSTEQEAGRCLKNKEILINSGPAGPTRIVVSPYCDKEDLPQKGNQRGRGRRPGKSRGALRTGPRSHPNRRPGNPASAFHIRGEPGNEKLGKNPAPQQGHVAAHRPQGQAPVQRNGPPLPWCTTQAGRDHFWKWQEPPTRRAYFLLRSRTYTYDHSARNLHFGRTSGNTGALMEYSPRYLDSRKFLTAPRFLLTEPIFKY